MKFYYQYGQDEILFKEIKKTNGVFLDIGAYDGITYSNTYFFEKLGWNGICIEPLPSIYSELVKNRKCTCINCAISDKEGLFEFIEILGNENDAMLSGFNRENIINDKQKYKKIKTYTFRLDTILKREKIDKIDLCSIDVEGHGVNVVKSINWKEYDINYLCIEASNEIEEVIKVISPYYEKYINVFEKRNPNSKTKGKNVADIIFKRK